ncbi:hypothetical protein AVT_27885 (plasmid) [Bacillus tropicus]|uniref:Uncharacterized protein n=1 Tax=Bacillus shihchuchen TaxID=3036942 RepID=A0ABT7L0Y6_9BACI|nr:hypothetical protein [Bacillus tropicus]MDL2419463.1 hypothetical protein [Bacillus shihchuchen]WBO93092.1 hypothetical protein AVT_27885 [Bacillus tropicus]
MENNQKNHVNSYQYDNALNKELNMSTATIKKQKARILRSGEKPFEFQAGISTYGLWYSLGVHTGPADVGVTFEPLADTTYVSAKVRYTNSNMTKVEEEYVTDFTIHCGNAAETVEICFKGHPFGTVVRGMVSGLA